MSGEEPVDLNKLREEALAQKARGEEVPIIQPSSGAVEEGDDEEASNITGVDLKRLREQLQSGDGVGPVPDDTKE